MQAIGESIFDIAYLITVIVLGIKMILSCRGQKQYKLFGIMAVVLGLGDAFHLIPRIIAQCTSGMSDYTFFLGTGKAVTSVTMTIFYVLLYHIWRERYGIDGKNKLTMCVYALAVIRIALCLFPQNQWTIVNPPLSWGIYRNIPFTILGIVIIVLFFKSARENNDKPFSLMWLAITLSFAFYIPVVLFADKFPVVGILMLPKTCAYVWAVATGYLAMKKE